jgi:hypothetical protein
MHTIHHGHVPRMMMATLIAAMVAMMLLLMALAPRVGDISLGSHPAGAAAATAPSAAAAQAGTPTWFTHPLAVPFTQRITPPWAAR